MELPGIDSELLQDGNYGFINGINFVWVKNAIYWQDSGERFYTISTQSNQSDEHKDNYTPSLSFSYFPIEECLKFSSFWEVDGINGKIHCKNTAEAEQTLTRIAKAYNNIIPSHVSDSNIIVNTIEDLN